MDIVIFYIVYMNPTYINLQIPYVITKRNNQIINQPKLTINLIGETLIGNGYPTSRPMKHYRKTGNTSSIIPTKSCNTCNSILVGKAFKLLGKQDNGINNQISIGIDSEGCLTCDPTRGPVTLNENIVTRTKGNAISFSGTATIRSATTNLSKTYYGSYQNYLQKRGKLHHVKSVIHRIPGVQYTDNGYPVWGNKPQSVTTIDRFGNPITLILNSSYYYTNTTDTCGFSIFNPSNRDFACQGGVESSTYLDRLKYNTITKNNSSFNKTYHQHFQYSPDPLYFVKNITAPRVNFNTGRQVCGSCAGQGLVFNIPLGIGGK